MDGEHDDRERRAMRKRIVELRNKLFELSGGQAEYGFAGRELTLAEELAFLERVLAYETAPVATLLDRLREAGYEIPDPERLSDAEIGLEVWQVIQRLSELGVYLLHTDHLSDRQLYETLHRFVLREEFAAETGDEQAVHQVDLLGAGTDEEIELWLRYYATDEDRAAWAEEWPDKALPPREAPPFVRDELLPRPANPPAILAGYLAALLDPDWGANDGPIHLANDLTAGDLAGVEMLAAARAVLAAIHREGKVKATAKRGNLPRALVKEIWLKLDHAARGGLHFELAGNGLNEETAFLVHMARVACEHARVLRKYRGHFVLTRRGEKLLEPERVGELYAALFLGFFKRTNLAYFDGIEPLPEVQKSLPIILWRLAAVGGDWIPAERLQKETMLPVILAEIERVDRRPYRTPGVAASIRLWRHLVSFGLLEPGYDDPMCSAVRYRVTPLFRKFLSFDGIDWSPA